MVAKSVLPKTKTKLSRKEVETIVSRMKPVEAPEAYANAIQVSLTGNDSVLVFSRPKLLVDPLGEAKGPVAALEPVSIIHLSLQTLKDLSVLLVQTIDKIESETGTIETEFTRSRVR